jgi:hypothetical protein
VVNYAITFTFFLALSFNVAFGHGNEKHVDSAESKEALLDEDGFEVISTAPSKSMLVKINDLYLKNVKTIFSNKCLSCHGVNTSPPWYYNIPGPKQLIDQDMKEAKKHMDMSNDFPFGGHGNPKDDLDALRKSLVKGDMPPFQYKMMHSGSGLDEKEIGIINNWIDVSKEILLKK